LHHDAGQIYINLGRSKFLEHTEGTRHTDEQTDRRTDRQDVIHNVTFYRESHITRRGSHKIACRSVSRS